MYQSQHYATLVYHVVIMLTLGSLCHQLFPQHTGRHPMFPDQFQSVYIEGVALAEQ